MKNEQCNRPVQTRASEEGVMVKISELFHDDWKNFFEASYDGIIIADEMGRIVYMNHAAEILEEVDKEYILGRYASDLLEEGIYETSVTVKVFKSKKKETIMQFKGGRQLVITGVPAFKNGKIKWVYINERDVTELAQIKHDKKVVMKQLEKYKKELEAIKKRNAEDNLLTSSNSKMQENMGLLQRIAPSEVSVLIIGESGVGKDVFANWIHKHSLRKEEPFIKIDCGALSESLLESELFGYEKNSFTGASQKGKVGLAEAADKGTLFLDEIGEMPLNLQTKLLRLVQDSTFLPVGSVEEKKVDIRIIAATNRDLEEMVEKKLFREDLYYRLNVVPVKLPPLRERKEDLFDFIDLFLKRYNEKHGYRKTISQEAVNGLYSYSWPGNVRELANIIERLVIVTPKAEIGIEDVMRAMPNFTDAGINTIFEINGRYIDAMDAFEGEYLKKIMGKYTTIKEMAEQIGISESTLKRRLRKHRLHFTAKINHDLGGQD